MQMTNQIKLLFNMLDQIRKLTLCQISLLIIIKDLTVGIQSAMVAESHIKIMKKLILVII